MFGSTKNIKLTTSVLKEFSKAQYSQSKSNPGLSGHDGLPAPSVDTVHALYDQPPWLYQEPFVMKKKTKLVGVKNSSDNTNPATIQILNTGNFCILRRSMGTL